MEVTKYIYHAFLISFVPRDTVLGYVILSQMQERALYAEDLQMVWTPLGIQLAGESYAGNTPHCFLPQAWIFLVAFSSSAASQYSQTAFGDASCPPKDCWGCKRELRECQQERSEPAIVEVGQSFRWHRHEGSTCHPTRRKGFAVSNSVHQVSNIQKESTLPMLYEPWSSTIRFDPQ